MRSPLPPLRLRPRRLAVPAMALALLTVAAACGSSGREMRPPEEGAVSPTRSTASTVPGITLPTTVPGTGPTGTAVPGSGVPGTGAVGRLSLSTTAFTPGGAIPAEYSCNGPSPALSWNNVPPGTAELALTVTDPDANGFVHWVLIGLPPVAGSVEKGEVPTGASQLANGVNKASWFGPCPPPGAPHRYVFTLYALPQAYSARNGTPAADVVKDLAAKASTTATVKGTFAR